MSAYYNDNDAYCCRVLRKNIAAGHLPPGDVDERDIRDVQPDELAGYRAIHLFAGIGGLALAGRMAGLDDDLNIGTGGFPCQDISLAGPGTGLDGARSGLWHEMARLLGALRPRHIVVENSAALLGRGWGVFSQTWPRSGMTQSGTAYQRRPWGRRICASGSSWWPTPTPRATDGDRGGRGDLLQAVRGNPNRHYRLWPTPTARDWRSGRASVQTHARNSRPLSEVAAWGQSSGQLNPAWVEWLQGYPIGWTDLGDSETP